VRWPNARLPGEAVLPVEKAVGSRPAARREDAAVATGSLFIAAAAGPRNGRNDSQKQRRFMEEKELNVMKDDWSRSDMPEDYASGLHQRTEELYRFPMRSRTAMG
jgi:hypothetical protein